MNDEDNDSNQNNSENDEKADVDMNGDQKMDKSERRKYTPYRFSGKSFSFDNNHEKLIIDNMRNWTARYFSQNSVITSSMYT